MYSIIIQAGGQSKRMARDKALVPFSGVPLIERLRKRFTGIGKETLVIHNDPESLSFLELPVHRDLIPDRGALGGLYTALSIASTPLIGLVGVDLPFASPALIQHLVNQVENNDLDACLPATMHGLEPMHAVYRIETCLPLVKAAIDRDLWRMTAWHAQAKLKVIAPNEVLEITGCEHTFLNLNTPEDLKKAEEIARNLQGTSC